MPLCQGRPDGPCADGKNDNSMHGTQSDLMLCRACDKFRFPVSYETRSKSKPSNSRGSSNSSHSIHGKKDIQSKKSPSVVKSATSATSKVSCAGLVQCNTALKQDSVNHIIPLVNINELLAYTRFYRNRSTPAAIVQVITNFFLSNEIAAAKNVC